MKITITLLCVWATLFLAGCDVKDPIYNTPHPDKGAIVITADWTQRGEGIATPSEYTTEAAGASCRDGRNCSATIRQNTLR